MKKPAVSVIIVVQNGENYLSEAIGSVLNQTLLPAEVLIVDGHSTDQTEKIAKSYPAIRYFLQEKEGLANARNTGIRMARGEFIAFLDHDDYWPPDKLQVQTKLFISRPAVQYSYGQVQLFLEAGCTLRNGFGKEMLNSERMGRTPGTLMARKSLFHQMGEFNPKYSIACDVDWFARARDYDVPSEFISQVLLHKRVHNNNLSGNVKVNKRELFRVIKDSLDRQQQLKAVQTK